jgi:hypothetical protein
MPLNCDVPRCAARPPLQLDRDEVAGGVAVDGLLNQGVEDLFVHLDFSGLGDAAAA